MNKNQRELERESEENERGQGKTKVAGCSWFTVWMLYYHSVSWPFRDHLQLCLLHCFSKRWMLRRPLWWRLFRRQGAVAKVKKLRLKAGRGRQWFTETLITVGPWSGRRERGKLKAVLKPLDKWCENSLVLKVGNGDVFVRLLTCPCGWCGFHLQAERQNPNDEMDWPVQQWVCA